MGDDPDGFLPRDEIVAYLERYAASFQAPVRLRIRALSVEANGDHYHVETSTGAINAKNVVIASGLFQKPKILPFSEDLPAGILQLHSGEYRNPSVLPDGAVLVIGSAQSGCQIAEELYQNGRKVYLCVGSSSGRVPRRYRGQDVTRWLLRMGFFDRTSDMLPSPKARFGGNPQVSGKAGGHTLNLHQFARDGVTLLGRILSARERKIYLAPDIKENLKKIDQFEAKLLQDIDEYIARNGLEAPEETLPHLTDGYEAEVINELDLIENKVTSIIWSIGYSFDFSWVRLPVFDTDGFPKTQRGVSACPGLYFLGMPWLHSMKSGLLFGVGEDAAVIAAHIDSNDPDFNL